ncbi:MAG: PAS domain-containing protein [Azospirillaceae bacterium]
MSPLATRDIDPSELTAEPVRAALDHWRALAADGRLPSRRDLDPASLGPALLPHVMLVDVIGRPPAFAHRLIGSHVTERLGRDYTGRRFEDCGYGDSLPAIRQAYERCVETGRPNAGRGLGRWADRDWLAYEIARMPLARDGATVDMIFAAIAFMPAEPGEAALMPG